MEFNPFLAPSAYNENDDEHVNAFAYLEEDEHDDRRAECNMEE